jgi:ferredoxin
MGERRLRVSVDEAKCVGGRMCQLAAPEVFRVDESRGLSQVLVPEVDESEEVWDALEGCPTEAISARDAETGEQVFP